MILAIRPEPGCSATVEAGRDFGLAIEGCPLFEVRPLRWDLPPRETFDALLLGSANAVRHAGPALDELRGMPAYTVGKATAAEAESAGIIVAAVGRGGLQELLDGAAAAPLRMLRLTGAEHLPVTAPPGIEIVTRLTYASLPRRLPDALGERLREGALVLLHSAAAARHFAAECARLEIPRGAVSLVALGPRIAAAAGEGWGELRAPPEPREALLLALARDMCQDPSGG